MNIEHDDLFADVRVGEARVRAAHDYAMLNYQQAISLCDGILQLESSAGFRQLKTTLEDMLAHRTSELFSARDDRAAAVLQGRCMELRTILGITTKTQERRDSLARTAMAAEDEFRTIEKQFKPQPPESKI